MCFVVESSSKFTYASLGGAYPHPWRIPTSRQHRKRGEKEERKKKGCKTDPTLMLSP